MIRSAILRNLDVFISTLVVSKAIAALIRVIEADSEGW